MVTYVGMSHAQTQVLKGSVERVPHSGSES